jgi:hypothetical protein
MIFNRLNVIKWIRLANQIVTTFLQLTKKRLILDFIHKL